MNRNSVSHYDYAPHENMNRSSFRGLSHSVKTSFDVGSIVPLDWFEVLPGDTFSIKTSKIVRLQTLLDPIMDDLFLDLYWFFVPNRIIWEHWTDFMGENNVDAWKPSVTYTIPQITAPASVGWSVGTIADYLGLPTGVSGISVSALPFRAYARICSEWFRNENTTDPINCPVDDTTIAGVNTGNQVTDIVKGGKPFIAAKVKDMFTACLPDPQKGPDVTVPLGTFAPVYTMTSDNPFASYPRDASNNAIPLHFKKVSDGGSPAADEVLHVYTDSKVYGDGTGASGTVTNVLYPSNLMTDLSVASSSSINQLRQAFQLQKAYELLARGGSRYIEIIKTMFGVTSPDYRVQRPEYLGGNRVSLNVRQVVQNSASVSGQTPQGHTAAYSLTADSHGDFSKSFTEHGILMCLACVRYNHTYQQGLDKKWSRLGRFDFYLPVFANVGEQPIYAREIYCDGSSNDATVFGYNEAWCQYRTAPNKVTGEMRSSASTSLDSWHLADDYASLPSLSSSWIQEDCATVDRVLSVSHSVSNQLFGDFYFDVKATRVMPVYSIPGLIDHH